MIELLEKPKNVFLEERIMASPQPKIIIPTHKESKKTGTEGSQIDACTQRVQGNLSIVAYVHLISTPMVEYLKNAGNKVSYKFESIDVEELNDLFSKAMKYPIQFPPQEITKELFRHAYKHSPENTAGLYADLKEFHRSFGH